MTALGRLLEWAKRLFVPREIVVRRYPLPGVERARQMPNVEAAAGPKPVRPSPAAGSPPVAVQPTSQTDRRGNPALLNTDDDIIVCLDSLAVSLRRKIRLEVPYEVHVVIPRAEITEKYQNGVMVERDLVYSSITIVHSPVRETNQ